MQKHNETRRVKAVRELSRKEQRRAMEEVRRLPLTEVHARIVALGGTIGEVERLASEARAAVAARIEGVDQLERDLTGELLVTLLRNLERLKRAVDGMQPTVGAVCENLRDLSGRRGTTAQREAIGKVTARGPRLVLACSSRVPTAVDLILDPTRQALPHFLPDPLASSIVGA